MTAGCAGRGKVRGSAIASPDATPRVLRPPADRARAVGSSAGDQRARQPSLGPTERDVVRHPAGATDQRGALGVDLRILLGRHARVDHRLVVLRRLRNWLRRRWRHRRRPAARQRLRHVLRGAVFGPGRPPGGSGVGLGLLARRLETQQGPYRTLRLAHHAGGLGGELQEECAIALELAGQAQAVRRVGVGGDELGAERGLGGAGGQQAGDLGDGGMVAAGLVLWRVGDRRREQAAERVDKLVVGIPREEQGEVGRFGVGKRVHGWAYGVGISNSQWLLRLSSRSTNRAMRRRWRYSPEPRRAVALPPPCGAYPA